MHGMKGLASALDVKTDRVHHAIGAGEGSGDRTLVVNVGLDRLKLRIIRAKQRAALIRMPRCNPNGKPVCTKAPNNAAAKKPGSAEHDDGALVRGRHGLI
jgi:hypothetical protein